MTRVLLRALVSDIAAELDPVENPSTNRGEFERVVLADHSVSVIVSADVASFYEYVDHAVLFTRIIDASAKADSAQAVVELLGSICGRGLGLPQGVRSVDLLADLILAPIERRLVWRGVPVARSNDDFRLGARSVAEARDHIRQLADELREIGLALNDEKTRIVERSDYEAHVGVFKERMAEELQRQLRITDERLGPYAGPVAAEPLPKDKYLRDVENRAWLERGIRSFLEGALEVVRNPSLTPPTLRADTRQRLAVGLSILTRIDSTALHEDIPDIHRWDPALAPQIGSYLSRASRNEPVPTRDLVGALLADVAAATPWEVAWLAQPFLWRDIPPTADSARRLSDLAGAPDVPFAVRSRLLHALSVHGHVSGEDVAAYLDVADDASKADIVAALLRRDDLRPKLLATLKPRPWGWISDLYQDDDDDDAADFDVPF
jgi:hypothetical protein